MLGTKVIDAAVLDLFAGTGALALEALSRGATFAVLVDNKTRRTITANVQLTHFADRTEILATDVFSAIKHLTRNERIFDLIFCDPPYGKQLAERAANMSSALMDKNSLLIVEHGAKEFAENPAPTKLNCIRRISYGNTTAISLFQKVYD